jgi:hypothetical protein
MQPETILNLRKRWSLKGNSILFCLLISLLPAMPATAIGAVAFRGRMLGTADSVTMLVASTLTVILIAMALRTAFKPADLIVTSSGLEFIGWRRRSYNWNELTVPKFNYVRATSAPGRCIEMWRIGPKSVTSEPVRIFDWYTIEFDRIRSFVAAVRGIEISPSATVPQQIPTEKSDRLKSRITLLRASALSAITVMALVQALDLFGLAEPIRELKVYMTDVFDPRPTKTLLVIGNSRTSQNNMPQMLRTIADADHYPEKIQFKMATVNGSTLETLWQTPRLQTLLSAQYDGAIVQGESRAQSTDELAKSYLAYGQKLLPAIKLRSGQLRLVVNWAYDPVLYQATSANRNEHLERMQYEQLLLAKRTGAKPLNIGLLWERVHAAQPQIVLTTDGNHPTVAGSYLFALLLYGDLSTHRVAKIKFVPKGVSEVDATALRTDVDDFLQRQH